MDIDDYDGAIAQLSQQVTAAGSDPQDFLERQLKANDVRAAELVRLRESLVAGADADSVSGLLVTGYFSSLRVKERVAAFLVCIEVARAIEISTLEKRLAAYVREQPLFVSSPYLYDKVRNGELLNSHAISSVRNDGMVKLTGTCARLDPMLPPALVETLRAEFPNAPLWVRLDPQFSAVDGQSNILLEAVLVPANPKWWKNLGLFRGQETGGKYEVLAPLMASDDLDSYLEFHVKGLRKLETIAQRKKADHLTCMLEELQVFGEEYLIGRCIHVDTSATVGTAPNEASVMHLDLAINVYRDSKVEQRMKSQLHGAEKEDATFRSHLLRIESVPFSVLPAFCAAFFQSRVMLRDLMSNQFYTA